MSVLFFFRKLLSFRPLLQSVLSLSAFKVFRLLNMAYQGDRGLKIRQALVSVSHDEYQDQHRLLGPFTPSSFSSTPASDDFWKAGTGYQSTPGWHSTKPNRGKPYRQLEWYSAIALFASGIYSTLLSGAWLTIAIMQPHWGHFVDSNGSLLSPTAASTLATGLAKTIEMSFLTFFLATMGQYLTRTASNNNVPGISLADIQLKIFVVSPGTLFTQWRSFGRALRSFLGIISLIACLATMLYVTASESLGESLAFLRYAPYRKTSSDSGTQFLLGPI